MSDDAITRAYEEAISSGILTQNPISQVYMRAGLLACREYMARFVEAESTTIAASIRANWWPALGPDPGVPRKLAFYEVADGGEIGPWQAKPLSASVEALPVALGFIQAADTQQLAPGDEYSSEGWFQARAADVLPTERTRASEPA